MTQQELKEKFDYCKTGTLIRKTSHSWRFKAGDSVNTKIAGTLRGYKYISINGRWWPLHRMVYLWHHGKLPVAVDHANRDRLDNRIENLREANHSKNAANTTKIRGITPYKGVTYKTTGKRKKRFVACITINRKQKALGIYTTAIEAAQAYDKAAKEIFGEFACTNF